MFGELSVFIHQIAAALSIMTDLSCDFTYIKWTILRIDYDFFYISSLSYLKGLGFIDLYQSFISSSQIWSSYKYLYQFIYEEKVGNIKRTQLIHLVSYIILISKKHMLSIFRNSVLPLCMHVHIAFS